MSFLVPEFLLLHLQSLTVAQDDMQTLSLFIRSNKKDYRMIIEVYTHETTKSNACHRLSLFYLANEIIQTERGTDSDALSLINGIKKSIPELFVKTLKNIRNDDLLKKYKSLGRVWIQRQIFTPEELNIEIDQRIGIEEITEGIRRRYGNKNELVKYLKELINNIENREVKE